MDKQQIPYKLLAKYLSGQCAPDEQEAVNHWVDEDPDHQLLLKKLQQQWDGMQVDTSAFYLPDKEALWNKIQEQIRYKVKQVPLYSRSLLIRAAAIAASVALLLGFSLSFLLGGEDEFGQAAQFENIVMAPSGQKTELILPDGTQVWLNSGSRLAYSYQYGMQNRIVQLTGEAFFDVKKNTQYPFTVKAGAIDVKVHGTAFNINAYREEADISVSLLRGKVSLVSAFDQHVLTDLSPGQIAKVAKSNLALQVLSCDAEVESSWHHNLLKFEGTPAEMMWKKLGRWYGVEITLSNIPSSQAYWFTLKTESLTELLERISKITPIEYKLNGKEVAIRYK